MENKRSLKVLEFVRSNPGLSSKEIFEGLGSDISYATLKRELTKLVAQNYITSLGQKKATKYSLSASFSVLSQIDIAEYFIQEVDERKIIEGYNFEIISILGNTRLFTNEENNKLNELHKQFQKNISTLTPLQYHKDMERLAVDLSWKSSQIEGNTYSLLETERLLLEKETAAGKSKDEAVMLLNHKDALDFIVENLDYLQPISLSKIENIHSILVKELNVDRNIRNCRVGITGTNYRPLDNEFQIREALEEVCKLINNRDNVFEKALLLLLLISYIQPFNDGNKRTARIVSNAQLLANKYCPISFRTVDSIDYKKAMLVFYEQNNISPFKQIFINQFEFAVKTYF